MERRDFIGLLCRGLAVWPVAARAQQKSRTKLICVLQDLAENESIAQSEVAAFRESLAQLGWTDGGNIRIKVGWAAGNPNRIRELAKDLVDQQPDAIVVRGTPATVAIARETHALPVVFTVVADPVGAGVAESLAHPGGNVTGFSNNFTVLAGKWVELLKEIAPDTQRVGLLFNPKTLAPIELFMPSIQIAASTLGIQVSPRPVLSKEEIEGAFAAPANTPGSGIIVMPDGFNLANHDVIVVMASRYRVPTIYFNAAFFADLGGLITYGPDFTEYFRLAAGYVDLILKGRKPADLPIQQPTNIKLVINLRTAKALGLDVPAGLLARADELIE